MGQIRARNSKYHVSRDGPGREYEKNPNFIKNFGSFLDFKWQFPLNHHKYCQFYFVIFVQNDVFFIPVEFESDQIRPREGPKMDKSALRGYFAKFFVNSELIFGIYDEKFFHVSPTILKFLLPNLASPNI